MNHSRILRHLAHVHMHHDDEGGNSTIAKATAMAVLFAASCILGNLPIKLNKWFQWHSDAKKNVHVRFLLGMGGGVLLCTTFIHLLPEVSENFEDLNLTPHIELHYAEILMCIGFFIMYFVEECVHIYLIHKEKFVEIDAIQRTLSIRRGEEACEKLDRLDEEDLKPSLTLSHTGHSHFVIKGNNNTVAIIRGLLVVLALSVHELFEGLAVGLESSPKAVWYMFGAVSAHKLVIAFCIGVELVTSGLKTIYVIIYVFMFAVVSPLGIGVGILLSNIEGNSTSLVSVILQGLASGTLMYVVFFEILQGDKRTGLRQYFAIFIGFCIMFSITILDSFAEYH